MAGSTSYPGGLDDFALASPTNLGDDDIKGRKHSERHDDIEAAMEAVQSTLGTGPLARTIADAQGDLIAATAADTVARLPVGTVGQMLGVDSTASTGLAWRSPGATNLLTTNQASLETDTTGWTAAGNCTIARSTAQAAVGSASLLVTVTSTSAPFPALTSLVPITSGRTYSAVASYRQSVGTRQGYLRLYWYDASQVFLSNTDSGGVTISGSSWTEVRVTGVAPAGAAYVNVIPSSSGGSVSDAFYIDRIGLWEGPGGTWALPGEPIQGLGTYWDESVGRRQFAWDSVNARWQMVYGDTGWRDVSAAMEAAFQVSNPTVVLRVRRLGSNVEWDLYETVAGTGSGTVAILASIPSGFRPVNLVAAPCINSATALPISQSLYISSPQMYGFGWTAVTHLARLTYSTLDAWPASLPGSASGSIPSS